jgi:hypothetical protein
VVALWPRSDAGDTVGEATTTTSTSTTEPVPTTTSSTTVPTTSTTSVPDDHVVETVEEAEAILRELWFGWFEGIYHEDEDRIREVVVLEETVETAKESFGAMQFSRPPSPELIRFEDVEILRTDADCLAVWSSLDVAEFRPDATGSSGVYVMRRIGRGWALLSVWPNRADLWEADCDSSL